MNARLGNMLNRNWCLALATLPWVLGAIGALSYLLSGPTPQDMTHYLPIGVVRAGYLLGSGIVAATLSTVILLSVGALHGFDRRHVFALLSSLAFPLVLLSLYSLRSAIGLAAIAILVTAGWSFSAYVMRRQ